MTGSRLVVDWRWRGRKDQKGRMTGMRRLRGNSYVHYYDCNDGIISTCIVKTNQIAHIKNMQLIVCQLHLNKGTKNTDEKCQKRLKSRKIELWIEKLKKKLAKGFRTRKQQKYTTWRWKKHKSNIFLCNFKGWAWNVQCQGKSLPVFGCTKFHQRNTRGGIIWRIAQTSLSAKYRMFCSFNVIYLFNYLLWV